MYPSLQKSAIRLSRGKIIIIIEKLFYNQTACIQTDTLMYDLFVFVCFVCFVFRIEIVQIADEEQRGEYKGSM